VSRGRQQQLAMGPHVLSMGPRAANQRVDMRGGPRWRPGLGEKPPQVIGARAEAGEEPEGAETNEGQREATCMAEASASTQRDREERGCLFLNRVEL
jgi:hypothetical protein